MGVGWELDESKLRVQPAAPWYIVAALSTKENVKNEGETNVNG